MTIEPENDTLPIRTVNAIAASDAVASCEIPGPGLRNSGEATSAAAPPPTPLNSATSCGIAVIFTPRAMGVAIRMPTATAAMIRPRCFRCGVARATTTASAAPALPIRTPLRAVRGADRPFRVRMKQTPTTR